MSDNNQPIPIAEAATLKELNIHIGYIREKMNANNETTIKSFGELKDQITLQAHNFVNHDEFKSVKDAVDKHTVTLDTLVAFKDTLIGKIWGVGVIAGLVAAILSFLANKFL